MLCVPGTAMAASSTHVRGTIESVKSDTLNVKTYAGKTTDVMLTSKTKYAWVVPSSLSSIKKGDFIGTAAQGPKNKLVAQEVVIFPSSMRGTGEGHYPWSMPAAVAKADANNGGQGATEASSGGPPVQGTMTNGTVASTGSSSAAPPVQGTMTNGTVASTSTSGGKELTISYGNGRTVQVQVPANAPIVRFSPAKKSIVKASEKVFIAATESGRPGNVSANFVAVGKNGLTPPM